MFKKSLNISSLEFWQNVVFFGNLVNSSFNFAFALLAVLLMDVSHLSPASTLLVISVGFFFSGMLQPAIGNAIDHGHIIYPIIFAFLGNALGIISLFSKNIFIIVFGVAALLLSSAIIQTLSTRVIEGFACETNRRELAMKNYILGNLGFAISAGIAFFFLRDYRGILLGLDVISAAFCCFILVYCTIKTKSFGHADHETISNHRSFFSHFSFRLLLVFLSTLALYIGMVASFSALQILYKTAGLDANKYTAIMIGTSTITVIITGKLITLASPPLWVRTIVGGALLGLGLTFQPWVQTLSMCVVMTILWSVGEILIVGDISAAFFSSFSIKLSGLASGIKVFTMRMAFVICPLLFLYFSPTTILDFFYFFGIPCFLSGAVLFLIQNK